MSMTAEQFDPTLSQIGQVVGVLDADNEIREEWLKNPIEYIRTHFDYETVNQYTQLLEGLLGKSSGSALGTPENAFNRQWYPIQLPGKDKSGKEKTKESLGIYLVTEHVDAHGNPTTDTDNPTVFGLGVMPSHDEGGVQITPYAYMPVLKLPAASIEDALVFEFSPVELGITVTRKDGKAFGLDPVTFDGLKLAGSIYLNGKSPAVPELTILNLKLPGDDAPSDRSLVDLEQVTIDEWIKIAVGILSSQLISAAESTGGTRATLAAVTVDLLNLFGLTGSLPSPDWETLPKDPAQTFLSWFSSIAGSPDTMKQWLFELYNLFKGQLPDNNESVDQVVTGTGTLDDPWSVTIFELEKIGTFNFTTAVQKTQDSGGTTFSFIPGIRISTRAFTPFAPTFPGAGFNFQASVDLIQLTLESPSSLRDEAAEPAAQLFPGFDILVVAANTSKGKPLISTPDPSGIGDTLFQIGTIQLGLSYTALGTDKTTRQLFPTFNLTDVNTQQASWSSINLLNADEGIKVGTEVLSEVLKAAVNGFLPDKPLAQNIAALIGVNPPDAYKDNWPIPAEEMLLGANRLGLLINYPIQALGAYFSLALTTDFSIIKDKAWKALIPVIGNIITGKTFDIGQVSGQGTLEQPWQMPLVVLASGNVTTYIRAYHYPGEGQAPILNLALYTEIPFKVGDFSISLDFVLDLLSLQLPAPEGTGSIGAQWLTDVRLELHVTPPESPPDFAGITVKADQGLVAAGWSRESGFYAAGEILNLRIVENLPGDANPITQPIGTIGFNTASGSAIDWDKIAQTVLYILGLWVFERGGRFGVLASTALGLLPNLPAVFDGEETDKLSYPRHLKLPSSWPAFKVTDPTTFYAQPWQDLKNQLAALISTGDNAIPLMRLIGWSFTGTLPDAPAAAPAGTSDDPWYVVLTNLANVEPLIWREPTGTGLPQRLGYGIKRNFTSSVPQSNLQVGAAFRLDIGYLTFSQSSPGTPLPRLSIKISLTNPDTGFIVNRPTSGLQIAAVQLGFTVTFEDTAGEPGIQLMPVLTLTGVQLDKDTPLGTVQLEKGEGPTLVVTVEKQTWSAAKCLQAMETLLDSFMTEMSAVLVEKFPTLQAGFDALTTFGLFQVTNQSPRAYGINPSAWQSLLANPRAFLLGQLDSLLQNNTEANTFFSNVSTLLGLDKIDIPFWNNEKYKSLRQAVLIVLEAFGLVQPAGDGYIIQFPALLDLVKNPVKYLKSRGNTLLTNAEARHQLLTEFAKIPPWDKLQPKPPIEYGIESGSIIRVSTSTDPGNPLEIAGILQLLFEVQLNLQTLQLSFDFGAAAPGIGLALMFNDTLAFNNKTGTLDNTFQFQLQSPPSNAPAAFEPLVFFSSAKKVDYTDVLLKRFPLMVLSIAATKLINTYVLPKSPIAQRIFTDVGLAVKNGDQYEARNILGALLHPLEWLNSPEVLGKTGGGIDFDKLGKLLYDITGDTVITGPGDIKLQGVKQSPNQVQGIRLFNLPYDIAFSLGADAAQGIGLSFSAAPSIHNIQIKPIADFFYSPSSGIHISGSVDLGLENIGDGSSITLTGAYQKEQFTLSLTAAPSGKDPLELSLVPFPGFKDLVEKGTKALIQLVGEKIAEIYRENEDKVPELLKTLVADILQLGEDVGISDFDSLVTAVKDIVKDPLAWLGSLFSDAARAGKILTDFKKILNDLKIERVEVSGTTLVYSLNENIAFSFGTAVEEGKTVFGLWTAPSVTRGWVTAEFMAGVTTPLDALDLQFQLMAALGTQLGSRSPLKTGPQLQLSFDQADHTQPFSLNLYPMGQEKPDNADLLSISMLPAPVFKDNGSEIPVLDWLAKFVIQFLGPFVVDTLLTVEPVTTFLNKPLISGKKVTPGSIAVSTQLLISTTENGKTTYKVANFVETYSKLIKEKGWLGFFTTFALRLLQGFIGVTGNEPGSIEFPFKTGGVSGKVAIVGVEDARKENVNYGLEIQLDNITIIGGENKENTPASTDLVLQIGKPTSGDVINKTSWIHNADNNIPADLPAGITVYFVKVPKGSDDPAFFLQPQVVNLGLDIMGHAQKPLINVGGVTLDEVELRTYFSITLQEENNRFTASGTAFGVGAQVRNLGIPLGPGFDKQLNNKNPVAGSLLSSDTVHQGGGQTATRGVNPSFSVGFGYVRADGENFFALQLYDRDEKKSDQIVIPVQRAFGPLQCRQLGVGWEGNEAILSFLFDGKVELAGLAVDLQDLTVGIPLQQATDLNQYQFGLKGMDVSFQGGPVEISGGLLENTNVSPTEYSGNVLVKAASFSLAAIGSYTAIQVDDKDDKDDKNGKTHPSLMVFALLDTPIGGPPYFFVTGIAAGFGYNRGFNPPAQDDVQKFPLIKGVTDPSTFGSTDAQGNYSPEDVLNALGSAVPARLGEYFLAAGLQFTSFELVKSFALLTVAFGRSFEIALLGLSTLQLPKTDTDIAYVYAELGIRVVFNSAQGTLQVSALLTPNSFVIDKDCRLTGGFAFYVWFPGSPHSGDFVLTLGGYNPGYYPDKPSYYPDEPRLGINWPVSSDLLIKGGAYFALTKSAVMAGGRLEATYQSGDLKAWFVAYADMLIRWKPFVYDVHIGVDIGASYRTFLGTFKVELGANVHIWGGDQRMRGKVHVTWTIISFTVWIGLGSDTPPKDSPVPWKEFKEYFLPRDNGNPAVTASKKDTADDGNNKEYKDVVQARFTRGVIRNVIVEVNGQKQRMPSISPSQLVMETQSVIPITAIQVQDETIPTNPDLNKSIGVGPMNSGLITSTHKINMTAGTKKIENIDTKSINQPLGQVPPALWSTTNEKKLSSEISNAMVRLTDITLKMRHPFYTTPPINIEKYLTFFVLNTHTHQDLPLPAQSLSPLAPVPRHNVLKIVHDTVMSPGVVSARQDILATLNQVRITVRKKDQLHRRPQQATFLVDTGGNLANLAAYVETTFVNAPQLGRINRAPDPGKRSRTGIFRSVTIGRPRWSKSAPQPGPSQPTAVVRTYMGSAQRCAGRTFLNNPDSRGFERALVNSLVKKDADTGDRHMTLAVGTSFVWNLKGHRHITVDGELPVRVTSFDAHETLLADKVLDSGEEQVYTVPARTAAVVISGLVPGSSPTVTGWQQNLLLVQANPGSLLGEGVVLRPQTRMHIRNRNENRRVGLRGAREVLNYNQDRWLTTAFQTPVKTVVVQLNSKDDPDLNQKQVEDELGISMAWLNDRGCTDFSSLLPAQIIISGSSAYAVCNVPAAPSADSMLLFSTRTTGDLRQTGLLGSTAPVNLLPEDPDQLSPLPRMFLTKKSGPLRSRVILATDD
jgi:hypothetical protein